MTRKDRRETEQMLEGEVGIGVGVLRWMRIVHMNRMFRVSRKGKEDTGQREED